ncbi:MAG: hypothetical protein AAGI34_07105 [Pseudomonadota bacterium]
MTATAIHLVAETLGQDATALIERLGQRSQTIERLAQGVCQPRYKAATLVVHLRLDWAGLVQLTAVRAANPDARLICIDYRFAGTGAEPAEPAHRPAPLTPAQQAALATCTRIDAWGPAQGAWELEHHLGTACACV